MDIQHYRRQNSRSSSPPDHRMCPPTSTTGAAAPSGRDSRPGKIATMEDGLLVNGDQTKEEEEEEEEEKRNVPLLAFWLRLEPRRRCSCLLRF